MFGQQTESHVGICIHYRNGQTAYTALCIRYFHHILSGRQVADSERPAAGVFPTCSNALPFDDKARATTGNIKQNLTPVATGSGYRSGLNFQVTFALQNVDDFRGGKVVGIAKCHRINSGRKVADHRAGSRTQIAGSVDRP